MGTKIRSGGRFFINGKDGGVASGWKVETFNAGSAGVLGTDNKSTFTDYTLGTAQTNPIVLDERGEAEVWWNGSYLIKVYDESDNFIYSLDYFGQGEDTEADSEAVPLNGSFGTDANADGTPDNWSLTPGTNGTVATDTADSAKGLTSLKFTGTDATGGGTATSDKFDVEKNDTVSIGYTYISSAVDTLNKIDINWYNAADTLLSTTSLLSEGAANPTSWTPGAVIATVPATAVRAEIVLTGVDGAGTTTSGNTWFDNIILKPTKVNASSGDITIEDQPAYGLKMLDTPTQIYNTTATEDVWTTYSGSALSTLNAKIAILYIWADIAGSVITNTLVELHARKGGSSVTNRLVGSSTVAAAVAEARDQRFGVECMVELDNNGQFDFKFRGGVAAGAGNVIIQINGYYV